MKTPLSAVGASIVLLGATSDPIAATWQPLVNSATPMPGSAVTKFYSFSPPSVNGGIWATFRAQDAGGTIRGVYANTFNFATLKKGRVTPIAQSGGPVPPPNDLGGLFQDFASFPRINVGRSTVMLVGQHEPVWSGGTTGASASSIFLTTLKSSPFPLETVGSQLGSVPAFSFWQVPGAAPRTTFDSFSDPSSANFNGVTRIVFRGDYHDASGRHHGIYFRRLNPAGSPVVSPVNTKTTLIPGLANTLFGYVSPPSAGGPDTVAFIGTSQPDDWSSTNNATWGAVMKFHYSPKPYLHQYVKLGGSFLGGKGPKFTRFGNAVSYNGRLLGYWGAWGSTFKPVKMVCPTAGDPAAIADCNTQYPTGNTPIMRVPVNQGIFMIDVRPKTNRLIHKTSGTGDDFVFWNYSAQDHTWHPSMQLAIDSDDNSNVLNPGARMAYKMRHGTLGATGIWLTTSDHIYFTTGTAGVDPKVDLLATGSTDGGVLDPAAAGMAVVGLDIERDGLRKKILGVRAQMRGTSREWAGIYLSKVLP